MYAHVQVSLPTKVQKCIYDFQCVPEEDFWIDDYFLFFLTLEENLGLKSQMVRVIPLFCIL